MKHLKDINNFNMITESLDIYDFGRKRGYLMGYYKEAIKLVKEFTPEVIEKLRSALPAFDLKEITEGGPEHGQYYIYVSLQGWSDDEWIIHYYGDYCYGLFRFTDLDMDDDGDLDWVEFCDELDPVIVRLMRNKKRLVG